jgi:DNA ligase (NAD+)
MFNPLSNLLSKLVPSSVELHATDVCPACGSQLARGAAGWGERPREPLGENQAGSPGVSPHPPEDWHCPNPDCPPQVLKRLELWVSPGAMAISGCDAAVVKQLMERGLVRDAAEFYRLKIAELASLDSFDLPKARTLWEAIQASKQREAWRVLFGLGIPHIGAVEAQTLSKHFASLEDLFATGHKPLAKLDGVTEIVARSLTHWYGDPVNRKLIQRLARAGVNFQN